MCTLPLARRPTWNVPRFNSQLWHGVGFSTPCHQGCVHCASMRLCYTALGRIGLQQQHEPPPWSK
jgi:hypothetical protein